MKRHEDDNRNIISRLWGLIVGLVRGYFVVVGILATILIGSGLFLLHKGIVKPSKTPASALIGPDERLLLEIPISHELEEGTPGGVMFLFNRLFAEEPLVTVPDITLALRRAAVDKQVKGVLFDIRNFSASPALTSQIRQSVEKFRKSGKKVFFYLNSLASEEYYLASAGDEIVMAPLGDISLTGPAFQMVYAKSLFDKIGVSFDVIRAGKYKSAMEPLVADEPSTETMTMYKTMEESLRADLVTSIAASRQRTKAEVFSWFKRSLFTPSEAVAAKIIDSVGYLPDIKDNIQKGLDTDDPINVLDYLEATENADDHLTEHGKGEIAFIEAIGTIYMDEPAGEQTESITPVKLIEELQWAAETDSIKAVVLRISSPGGSALASDLIWNEVKKLASSKPVVASFGEVAATGGYYLAAPTTYIISEPNSITGSIGVIGMVPNLSKIKEKYGVSFYMVTETDRAGTLNIGKGASSEDRELLAHGVDFVYGQFISKVADGRKLPVEQVARIAEGRVYTGTQALEIKLVDSLGSLDDAFRQAKVLAKLNPERLYPVARYEAPLTSPLQCLSSTDSLVGCLRGFRTSASYHLLPGQNQILTFVQDRTAALRELLLKEKLIAYLPYNLMKQK